MKQQTFIKENKGTVIINHLTGQTGQSLGMLAGIGDGCRTADKLGIGAIHATQTAEATQHTGYMGAKNATVDMGFIHYHIPQVTQ